MSFEGAESLEVWLIKYFGRRDQKKGPLVNLTDGGGGTKNPSKEHRQNISRALIGRKFTEEHRAKLSKALTGRKFTEGHRVSLFKSAQGKVLSEEHKDNISKNNGKGMLNKKHTKESRALMSQNRKGGTS